MSLKNGLPINSYEELIETTHHLFLYQPHIGRHFSYMYMDGVPMMVDIHYGDRYFSTDIKKYLHFPMHQFKLEPWTQDDEDALDV
jgi:hypothetical protein